MIENKGLTDEQVQALIDKDIETTKWIYEVYLPMIVRQRIFIEEINKIREKSQDGKRN